MYPGTARFESIDISYRDGSPFIDMDVLVPEEDIAAFGKRAEAMQRYLTGQVGQPVHLRVEVIPIKVVTYDFPPAAAPDPASPATGLRRSRDRVAA